MVLLNPSKLIEAIFRTTEGGPKRNLGTEALSRAEPEVPIHFPPAVSLRTFSPSTLVIVDHAKSGLAPSKPLAGIYGDRHPHLVFATLSQWRKVVIPADNILDSR